MSLNALKHGLLSREVLLPNEDEKTLLALGESLRSELQPMGELKEILVDRILSSLWRLRRLGKVEAGIFSMEYFALLAERARKEASCHTKMEGGLDFSDVLVGETIIIDKKAHDEAIAKALKAESETMTEIATLGLAFVRNIEKADTFSKLSRYEVSIERSLYKALHELQRLQAARSEVPIPLPPVMEVEADVTLDAPQEAL